MPKQEPVPLGSIFRIVADLKTATAMDLTEIYTLPVNDEALERAQSLVVEATLVGKPDREHAVKEVNNMLYAMNARIRTPWGLGVLLIVSGCVQYGIAGSGCRGTRGVPISVEHVRPNYGLRGGPR